MEEGELLVCLRELAEEVGGGDCLKSPEAQERIKPAIELLKSRMRNLKEFLDLLDAYVTDRPLEYDAEGARTYEVAHAEFCREHLFRWAPEFFQRVEQGADTDFYRGIGILGQDACAQVAAALVDAAAG